MADLFKWNVSVEYGPTSADVHHITVDSATSSGALDKANQWAKDNNIMHPMFSEPYKEPEDDYDDYLEWTPEEEEKFIHIMDMNNNIDER